MTAVAVRLEHPAHRHLRMLGADQLLGLPGIGSLARKTGTTLACTADADDIKIAPQQRRPSAASLD